MFLYLLNFHLSGYVCFYFVNFISQEFSNFSQFHLISASKSSYLNTTESDYNIGQTVLICVLQLEEHHAFQELVFKNITYTMP